MSNKIQKFNGILNQESVSVSEIQKFAKENNLDQTYEQQIENLNKLSLLIENRINTLNK